MPYRCHDHATLTVPLATPDLRLENRGGIDPDFHFFFLWIGRRSVLRRGCEPAAPFEKTEEAKCCEGSGGLGTIPRRGRIHGNSLH